MQNIHKILMNSFLPAKDQQISLEEQVSPSGHQNTSSIQSSYRRFRADNALLKQTIEKNMERPLVINEAEAKKRAEEFLIKYNLPVDAEMDFDAATHTTTLIWRGDRNMDLLKQKFPEAFHKNDWLGSPVQKAKFEWISDQPIQLETVYFGQTSWGHDYPNPNFLVQKGVVSCKENSLEIQIRQVLEVEDSEIHRQLYDW